MALETERKKFVREHFWYCEVENGGVTYRFCENRSPLPVGFSGVPSMRGKPSIRPAQVALDGGIGVRASASVSFDEHQDYTEFGTITTPVRFWPNWYANNRGYQGARLSVFSGYIVNNAFNIDNFQRRDYILDSFKHSESGASITAKDALKLTVGDRAKAPRKSTGQLNTAIDSVVTTFTLTPAGVGALEYPADGWVRIGDEVMSFTRVGDDFTVVRGQYNTSASDHDINDVAQLCLYYNQTLADIIYDLYTVYSGVPVAQINKIQWDDETSLYLPGLLEALITEPVGVDELVKELADSAPHYQYWDERDNTIKLIAIKPPPDTAQVVTAEDNLLRGSTSIKDQQDMRISNVIVRFGQFDPTKDLDEASNYRQGHLRLNPLAVARYNGIEKYKVINSRWINNDNRAAAVRLAGRLGRRFEDTPRKISFSLDAKDADVWTGSSLFINSDLVVNDLGSRYNMPAQVISAGESNSYKYEALEHTYGPARPEDLAGDDPNQRLVVLSGDITNINLRNIYDGLFADVIDDYEITIIFDQNCVAGSTSTTHAVDTGSWPELTTKNITLDVRGLIAGKGGSGASVGGPAATAGGLALLLSDNINLTNTGIIGGGGGGGAADRAVGSSVSNAAGGGGAGFENGPGGTGTFVPSGPNDQAEDGTNTSGGSGGYAEGSGFEPAIAEGGDGGNLGNPGQDASEGVGGAAGAAINTNSYTITYLETGDIRGAIL